MSNQSMLRRFRGCSSGATAIEYCMVAALLAVAALGAWTALGSAVGKIYNRIGSGVTSVS